MSAMTTPSARNSFLRLFEDCLAAKSSVAVPVVVAIEITGVVVVFVL